jgi:transketolase
VTPTYTYSDLPALMSRLLGDEKHRPSATSTLDVIWVLYDRVLNVSPDRLRDLDRDRFVLSKGHGPMAYYAVLVAKGFLPESELANWGEFESRLGHHPDRVLIPGVEASSGSLGHGLGLAVGMALGLRAQGRHKPRVFVLVGDAELDEGSNHEAIHYAGAVGLDSLVAIVVDNRSRTHVLSGGLGGLFQVAGWEVREVSGRDHDSLDRALCERAPGRPVAVVAAVEGKR